MDNLTLVIAVVALILGVALGSLGAWLVLLARTRATESILHDRLRAREDQIAAAVRDSERREQQLGTLREENATLRESQSQLRTTLSEERKQTQEKLTLLQDARDTMTAQFKNLANEIFEQKSVRFTEQNKQNIGDLLKPLSERIKDFEQKVTDTYDRESKERFSLQREIKNLADLNQRINEEAANLTNALKGQTKTQGNWGELILERVLEKSGLQRGREYEVQESRKSDEGKNYQPDVVIYLPEDKHLIVDSKVTLTAYERFCSAEEETERAAELKKHIAAFRKHVEDLSGKRYQDLYGIRSPDLVLLFVPIEPAFSLAVQHDLGLFSDAFEKNIVIVSPSTLLATLRTIASIWRQEHQNRNALEIAKQAGALYDKFVGFAADLDDVGTHLQRLTKSYDEAHKKLHTGRGNLVGRAERIKQLGAKAGKSLPAAQVADALEDGDEDEDVLLALGDGD